MFARRSFGCFFVCWCICIQCVFSWDLFNALAHKNITYHAIWAEKQNQRKEKEEKIDATQYNLRISPLTITLHIEVSTHNE